MIENPGKQRSRQVIVGNVVRGFPVVFASLGFAFAVTCIILVREYGAQQRLEREGIAVADWSPIDALAFPGIYCAYVVASVSNSGVAALVAGVIGMTVLMDFSDW